MGAGAGRCGRARACAAPGRLLFGETYQKGYVVPEGALEQIPIGASQEQVLILMGTPSTVATVSGEVFYYISQRAERRVAFMPQAVVDQRVVAVYFDRNRRVAAAGELRHARRPDLRLHQPHHAERRRRDQLPRQRVQGVHVF